MAGGDRKEEISRQPLNSFEHNSTTMQVQVFRTNIRFKKQLKLVSPHLNSIKGIHRWNIDFQDRDRILRIETELLPPLAISRTLREAGFVCDELD